ncbi:MAG: helix-turn-helix domain-containing protein [Rufibacter sp.]
MQPQQLYQVWKSEMKAVQKTEVPIHFNEIVSSSIFTAGPSYYFVIDFYDMSISHLSASAQDFGIDLDSRSLDSILDKVHPDDLDFVKRAENKIIEMYRHQIGWDKLLSYKNSYCFRVLMPDGTYHLLLHQNIIITLDEYGGYAKSLNIHTDINHLTTINNYKISIIGLNNYPSFLNIAVSDANSETIIFTPRETEVLKLVSQGHSSRQISNKLFIAIDTVKNHRRNLLAKAGVKTTAQLIKTCMLKGII